MSTTYPCWYLTFSSLLSVQLLGLFGSLFYIYLCLRSLLSCFHWLFLNPSLSRWWLYMLWPFFLLLFKVEHVYGVLHSHSSSCPVSHPLRSSSSPVALCESESYHFLDYQSTSGDLLYCYNIPAVTSLTFPFPTCPLWLLWRWRGSFKNMPWPTCRPIINVALWTWTLRGFQSLWLHVYIKTKCVIWFWRNDSQTPWSLLF